MEQNTALRKEINQTEKRLLGRNERIQNLEQVLTNTERKYAIKEDRYEATVQALRNQLIMGEYPYSYGLLPKGDVSGISSDTG